VLPSRLVPSAGPEHASVTSDLERLRRHRSEPRPPIPEEALERIFDRFYRLDPSRSSSGRHWGIGLSLSRALGGTLGLTLCASNDPDGYGRVVAVDLYIVQENGPHFGLGDWTAAATLEQKWSAVVDLLEPLLTRYARLSQAHKFLSAAYGALGDEALRDEHQEHGSTAPRSRAL